jgi:methyl-accepting chemotaxis protein
MFDRIRQLAAPPVFTDDDKTRRAGLLNTVALAFLVVSVGGSLLMAVGLGQWSGLINGAVFLLLELAVLFLMRRGHVLPAGLLQVGLLWLIITVFNVIGDGVRAQTFSSCILVVLLASLLLGRHYGLGAALLSIATGLGMLWAEAQGWIMYTGVTPAFALVAQSTHFLLAAVLIGITLGGLQAALQRSRENYVQLQAAQATLQQQMEIEREQRGQLQQLMRSEQEQRGHLQQLLAQVQDAANRLGGASIEILVTTAQQATGAAEQSSAIVQASTTIAEARAIAEQTAEMAGAVAGLAQHTAEVSQTGQQAVVETIGGMEQVRERVESITGSIRALARQSQAIGQIIATVNEIAAQSNLLALNAAVEAARAGQAGRGFAVVAQEVRHLAEQSQAATAQVRDLLTEVRQGVGTAVVAAEQGMHRVTVGMKLAGEAGLSIRSLADNVQQSTHSAQRIAAAAAQQVTGMEQVAQAMAAIQHVAMQNVASSQQLEESAGKLNELARQLRRLVGQED